MKPNELIDRLYACSAGEAGWKEFEDACTDILCYLFVPPLMPPKRQPRTRSGTDRRDVAFPNRERTTQSIWAQLRAELDLRMVVCDFKNYHKQEIGKTEVDQLRNYLSEPIGRFGILCCNKRPDESAHIRRNTIYSLEKKVILFLLPTHLQEMIYMKERGEDPAGLIVDMVEEFYLQYE